MFCFVSTSHGGFKFMSFRPATLHDNRYLYGADRKTCSYLKTRSPISSVRVLHKLQNLEHMLALKFGLLGKHSNRELQGDAISPWKLTFEGCILNCVFL